jgi:hypothetical protein
MLEAQIKAADPADDPADDRPATHQMLGCANWWRKGPNGFAELNMARGRPGLVNEWLVTGWRNEDLDRDHPFSRLPGVPAPEPDEPWDWE